MYNFAMLTVFLLGIQVQAGDQVVCSENQTFTNAGWVVHPSENFAALSNEVLAQAEAQASSYVFDLESNAFSRQADRWVRFKSMDNLLTEREEMFGDLVEIRDWESGELLELRWYADGKKHLIYNPLEQGCATSFYPYAVNALF